MRQLGSGARLTSCDSLPPVPSVGAERVPIGRHPRIYLHIGEPKTGTSFLQSALWNNRARLASLGVLLPGYSHRDHNRASRDLREAPRAASDPADPWVGEWDVLTGQALRARGVAVISDEVLAACTPAQADRGVRSLLSADVHVILTVRDFASVLPAEWQEAVKCRGTVPWEEWLDSVIDAGSAADRRRRSWFWTVHDTLAILDMWSRHIPPDHVHVITLPQQGPPEALWIRFASILGIGTSRIDLTNERTNPSLRFPEAEFLRRFNEALPAGVPDWFYTRDIKRILAHEVLGSRQGQARLALPADREAWAREQSEILVAALRDSKYHVVGDLSELLPRSPAERHAGPGEQVLDAAVQAAAAVMHRFYLEKTGPAERQRQSLGSLRQMVSRMEWAMLNGPRTKRVLRTASHHSAVRRLRVAIWRVLMHPARYRP